MKKKCIFIRIFFLLVFSSLCEASTTLVGTAIADVQNTEGVSLAGGLLGIYVADTGNNGFAASTTSSSLSPGDSLVVGVGFGSSDDLIFSRKSTTAGGFGSTSFGGDPSYDEQVYGGYQFGVYIFTSNLDDSSDVLSAGTSYGFVTNSDGSGDWILPASSGEFNFAATPSGSDLQSISSSQFGGLTVAIPEPSAYTTIAGLLGLAYAVSRRRRRSSSLTRN